MTDDRSPRSPEPEDGADLDEDELGEHEDGPEFDEHEDEPDLDEPELELDQDEPESDATEPGAPRPGGAAAFLRRTVDGWLAGPDPPLAWTLRGYRRSFLRGDLVAGITVSAFIVPLSIGYAQVAGLPPEVGLYASLVPLLAYAIFGSARRLIVGPDSATAALVGATIAPLAVVADDRVRLAAALALLVALVFIAMRLASLGFLADLLSRPILVGYMTGVGINVVVSQIPKIVGGQPLADVLDVLGRTDLLGVGLGPTLEALGLALGQASFDLPSILVGLGVLGAILVGDRLLPGIPIALPALVVALVASNLLDLAAGGMLVLGPVPAGLPPIALPLVSLDTAIQLLPGAVGIAILSFADTALTGRSFSARHGEVIDPNRELVALSTADLGASLTSGYPISSSPSRTAAADASGAQTQLTSIVAAGAVALVLIFLTGILADLPIPALGAVVIAAALRFIDIRGVIRIWGLDRVEGAIAITAILGVVFYGTLAGVGVAAALAAVNVFRRAAAPQIDELGVRPDGLGYSVLGRRSAARRVPGVLVVRFTGPLFFATSGPFRTAIRTLLVDRPDVRAVVVDAAPIADLDLTAAESLTAVVADLRAKGILLMLARATGRTRQRLRAFGLGELVPSRAETRRDIPAVVAAALALAGEVPDGAAPGERGEGADGAEGAEVGERGEVDLPGMSEGDEARLAATDRIGPTAREGVGPEPEKRRWSIGLVAIVAVVVAVFVIALVLGSGEEGQPEGDVAAPSLVGLSLDRARETVDRAGLVLGEPTFVQSTSLPEGTVVTQSPDPGSVIPVGSVIDISVSTGRGLVIVPDVAGQTEGEAIVELTTAGLVVGGKEVVPDAEAPAGTVIATEPAAGREVAEETPVRLIVSSGPPPDSTSAPTPRPTPPTPATPTVSPSVPPASPAPTAPPTSSPPGATTPAAPAPPPPPEAPPAR